MTYQFDALGRRVARDDGTTVTVFVQSGQQTIADYVSGAVPASPTYTYVYASYIDEPVMRAGVGGLRYLHRNQQYSVIALTDSAGAIKERYAYDAYGSPVFLDASGSQPATSSENNRYLYTGREYDEALGLYHYRARMYDSVAGRFCSRDPIGYADDYHLYAYLLSGLLSSIDPSGNCKVIATSLVSSVVTIGGAVRAGVGTSTKKVALPDGTTIRVPDVSPKILDHEVVFKVTCAKLQRLATSFECDCNCDGVPEITTEYTYSFNVFDADLERNHGVTVIKARILGLAKTMPGFPKGGPKVDPFLPLPGIELNMTYWQIHPSEMKFATEACKEEAENVNGPIRPASPVSGC
ncbi:tRNA3(Ser)-specific nuclease WapA precursor [Planctomycetes bacterium CA13]|uniref:tRNA3(Ser)-specific nuclease WapA n=1 Tax=Novipirellula herctigrandis TaxID=2527986 RepID=A0A5C5YLQ1_9BACT|nr:tRNA3(Ser)-specific nuclease WapA precursor [Planctomycetes bacterium CA13]